MSLVGVGSVLYFFADALAGSHRALEKVKRNSHHPEPHEQRVAIFNAMADRTFAKFSFFKIDPAWRRRDPELRAADKQEFLAAREDSASTARCAPTQP